MTYINKYILLIFIFVVFLGCKNDKNNSSDIPSIDDMKVVVDAESLSVLYNNKSYSIPSPHQASMIIKKNNIPFNADYVNPISNSQKYITILKQALNLGVYGTDVGYLNIYGQTDDAIKYFFVVKKLTDELNILNSLDINLIKSIENNFSNSDSLVHYLSIAYKDADIYLKQNNRSDVGALIIAGGWIESLYIVSQYYLNDNNPLLYNYIGEQKYPLNNLIEILSPYYNQSEDYSILIDYIVDLAYIFDAIDFTYTHKSQDKIANKTVINTESEMEAFDDILTKISKKITTIRNYIIE